MRTFHAADVDCLRRLKGLNRVNRLTCVERFEPPNPLMQLTRLNPLNHANCFQPRPTALDHSAGTALLMVPGQGSEDASEGA